MAVEEPFPDRLKRLAAARGLSVSKVSYMAWKPDLKGTSPNTLNSVMAGRRPVTAPIVEAVAQVLQVQPDEFPEYRLLMARRALDEREVGFEAALRALSQFESALDTLAQPEARPESPRAQGKTQRTRAKSGGTQKQAGG